MTKRFTEEQILAFICEADTGVPVRALCSKHGFSERSYYQWRARIVGSRTSLAQQLAHLHHENEQLREMLAGASLDPPTLRAADSFGTNVTGKDLCETLLRVQALAQEATDRLLGLRESESLQWPELVPFPDSPSTQASARSSKGDWKLSMAQQEAHAASVCA